jgi:hypothetical protein
MMRLSPLELAAYEQERKENTHVSAETVREMYELRLRDAERYGGQLVLPVAPGTA